MRLIRITTNYITYLRRLYSNNPILGNQSYISQYDYLMSDCFGWADFWTYALSKLGYEVWELVANAEIMQKAWAKENNIYFDSSSWLLDIIQNQVISYKPDILFVDDYNPFSKNFLLELRASCPSIKLVLGWCGAPYNDASVFFAYDLILSNIPELVVGFQNSGHQAQYFKHAFDPRILERIKKNTSNNIVIPFSFIGSIVLGKLAHNQRIVLIKELVEKTDLNVFCDVYKPNYKDSLYTSFKGLAYDFIHFISKQYQFNQTLSKIPKVKKFIEMSSRPALPPQLDASILNRAKSPVYGIEMFQTLYNSQVTFNNHIDLSRNSASNMRLFEATGVGTCLLTDWQPNLHELFEPDVEVVTYRSTEECIEKINWLLDNPAERDKIAEAGQARTLRDHTFDKRAVQLDAIIQNTKSYTKW